LNAILAGIEQIKEKGLSLTFRRGAILKHNCHHLNDLLQQQSNANHRTVSRRNAHSMASGRRIVERR
jgi:hypothetical protein